MRLFIALLVFTSAAWGASPDEWRHRVIYQLLTDRFALPPSTQDEEFQGCDLSTYCGGTWSGITSKLDYIQGLGADAIWISPVVKNTPGGYHGYWMEDIYSLNPHFGSEQDLQDMVNAAHQHGMYVMLDVVGNHMGNNNPLDDFSHFIPFNDSAHYHDYCEINDWGNQHEVEFCRLANLPDLQQENNWVASTLTDWIKQLVTKYQFDGIRVDTTPEVPKWFWTNFNAAAGVYSVGEVENGDPSYVSGYQGPLSATLGYPMFWTVKDVFQNGNSMTKIQNLKKQQEGCFSDTQLLGNFQGNHDQARWLNGNGDYAAFKGALTFLLTSDGIPIVYYGQEQGYAGGNDPNNREPLFGNYNEQHELYKYISMVVAARKKYKMSNSPQQDYWVDDTFYAFARGSCFIATTCVGGNGAQQHRTIPNIPFSAGTKLCNIECSFSPGTDCVTVSSSKTLDIYLVGGESKVYVPQ